MTAEKMPELGQSFKQTGLGRQLGIFMDQLYSYPESYFPLSLPKSAILLCFVNESSGSKVIQSWNEKGVVSLGEALEGHIYRPHLVVLKLTQVLFHELRSYAKVYKALKADLTESGLEYLVGEPKQPLKRVWTNTTTPDYFLNEDGSWYIDDSAFKHSRIRI